MPFSLLQQQYQALIDLYQNSDSISFNSTEVNKDISKAIALAVTAQGEGIELKPAIISLFLANQQIFNMLQAKNFHDMCLATPQLRQQAIDFFNEKPLLKPYLQKLFNSFKAGLSTLEAEQLEIQKKAYLELTRLLLSCKPHLEYFSWQEILDIYKSQDHDSADWALDNALNSPKLLNEIIGELQIGKSISQRAIFSAASQLTLERCKTFLSSNENIYLFISKLAIHQPAWLFVKEGNTSIIEWVVDKLIGFNNDPSSLYSKLCEENQLSLVKPTSALKDELSELTGEIVTLRESLSEIEEEEASEAATSRYHKLSEEQDLLKEKIALIEADEQHKISNLVNTSLNEIFEKTARYHPELFLELIKKDKALELVSPNKLIYLFNDFSGVSKATQKTLIDYIISRVDYLENTNQIVVQSLLVHSDLDQFKKLIKIENIRASIESETKDYILHGLLGHQLTCDKDRDVKLEKARHIYSEEKSWLKLLTPKALLDITTNPNYSIRMQEQTLQELLENPKLWQNYQEAGSEVLDGNKLRGLNQASFNILTKHDAYKEAYIRAVLADPLWTNMGYAFFGAKIPTTILKARSLIDGKPYPLSKADLQELMDVFKESQHVSHGYFCDAINLRNTTTQAFYNKVAAFDDVEQTAVLPTPEQ